MKKVLKKRTRTDCIHNRSQVLTDIDLLSHILNNLDDTRELCRCALISKNWLEALDNCNILWESIKVLRWDPKVPFQSTGIVKKQADLVKNITLDVGDNRFTTHNIPRLMRSLTKQFKNLCLVKLDTPIGKTQTDNLNSDNALPKALRLEAPHGVLATDLDTIHTDEQWKQLRTFMTDSHSGQRFQPKGLWLSIGRGPMAKAKLRKDVLGGLGQLLCKNSAMLCRIDLRGQHLGPDGAKWLVADLREPWNQELDSLNLTDNGICGIYDGCHVPEDVSGAYDASGLEDVLHVLVDKGCLKSLDLSRNVLNVRKQCVKGTAKLNGIHMLSNAISATHCPLTTLRLDDTRLAGRCSKQEREDTQALEWLAQALKTNTSLTDLYLCGNFIGAQGAAALAPGLEENSTLTSLDISDNDLGSKGATSLSEAVMPRSSRTSAIKVLTCDVKLPIERILKGEIAELDLGGEGGLRIEALVILQKALQHNSELSVEEGRLQLTRLGVFTNDTAVSLYDGFLPEFMGVISKLGQTSSSDDSCGRRGLEMFCNVPMGSEQQWISDNPEVLDLQDERLGFLGASLLAFLLQKSGNGPSRAPVTPDLPYVHLIRFLNVLGCGVGMRGARLLQRALEKSATLMTLCGLSPGEKEVEKSNQNLKPWDAILLAADLTLGRCSSSLVTLRLDSSLSSLRVFEEMVPRRQAHHRGIRWSYGDTMKSSDGTEWKVGRRSAGGDVFLQREDDSGVQALAKALHKINTFETLALTDFTWTPMRP
ncbi:hypothetical protein CYMTET_56199 [Cymbomonas tetramitiformis]|uniref:F-box domain-containing protein n=1 Tax=Cymbomonas tetramitiformis TaxID=36881 RepID=A0AAE0EM25_9CHLO|nr:hypothetical protein CYMTET_56199 [Cymbomonas tetramitiformis]